METIYRAFDGTEFETKAECKKYENLHDYTSLKMLDEYGSSTTNVGSSQFIVIRDDLDKRRVENLLNDDGFKYDDIKTIPIVITWDDTSNKWKDILVEIESLQEKLTKLKEVLSMVKENEE